MPIAHAFDVRSVAFFFQFRFSLCFVSVHLKIIMIMRVVMRYWNEEGARGQRKRALSKALASPMIQADSVL